MLPLNVLLAILSALVVYSLFRLYHHLHHWQRQHLPSLRFWTFSWATQPFHEWTIEMARVHGPIYGGYKSSQMFLVINDPKVARELSSRELHRFPLRFSVYPGTSNIRRSLFFMEANDDWKRIRAIVSPAFTTGKLKRMLSPIERITHNFIEHIRPHAHDGAVFDLKKYIGGFAMDVITCCAYGVEIDSVRQADHPVVRNAKKILNVDATFSLIMCVMFPTLARWLRLEMFDKDAVDYFDKLTFQIVNKRLQTNETKQNPDIIGLMIENSQSVSETVKDIEKSEQSFSGITKEEIAGQGIIFFIAGFDTTHATFDHVIYHLTQYPEWQKRLFLELSETKDKLNYDKLKELPILNAIINETLRLRPPLLEFTRQAKEDCTLLDTGIQVPKDTLISFHPYVIHRNPDYFPDPLAFKPERFLDKTQSTESNFAFVPFGSGQRLCVGMRFAQNELRIGLAHFVLNYEVTAEPNMKLEYFRGSVLMSPKNLMVQIREREKTNEQM